MMQLSGQDWSTLSRGTRQWIPVLSGVPQKGRDCKRFGIEAAGRSENAFVFQSQWEFSFTLCQK